MSQHPQIDPWDNLAPGELEYRQKLDKRNSRTNTYKDAPRDSNKINGPNGKSFKSSHISTLNVAHDMETLTDSVSYNKKKANKGSDYTIASGYHKRDASSSIFSSSEDGVTYSTMNKDLGSIGCNESLHPDQLKKIEQLLQNDIAKRSRLSDVSTESLVQDLYRRSQGVPQYNKGTSRTSDDPIDQLFEVHKNMSHISSDIPTKIKSESNSRSSHSTTSIPSNNQSNEQDDKEDKHREKRPKLEGGFGLIKFQTPKSLSKNKETSLRPKSKISQVVTTKSDPGWFTINNSSSDKPSDSIGRRIGTMHKIGIFTGLSDFANRLINSEDFMQCTFGVVFCDCKCTGCEFVHTESTGNLVPGADCYYQTDESKIEYCKFDPRWNTSEFDSREIYDNFVGPILLFEESLGRHMKQTHGKTSLLYAIEMFESNKQIMPISVSIFFTSNLDRIELAPRDGGKTPSEELNDQKIIKPTPFCWSKSMDMLFTKKDEDIKKIFDIEDVTKIVRQIKSVDSVNRRVCCNKFNRSDTELFEFISCKNSGFMDASSGIIKLHNCKKDKDIMENIFNLKMVGGSGSHINTMERNKDNDKVYDTPVRCKSTVNGITYEYTKSYLVAIIDSKLPSNPNIMIRACFVLGNIIDKLGNKSSTKEKLVNMVSNFNSSEVGKREESKYNFDVFGNQVTQQNPSFSSSSASRTFSNHSSAIGNQDTMTEESCFRPVMYSVDKLENSNSGTIQGLMWNEMKISRLWRYVRSHVVICPRSSNIENE